MPKRYGGQVIFVGWALNPEYYILEYPKWVNVIGITKDGNMALVRQYRHGLGETRLELCAGVVEEGETPLEGANASFLRKPDLEVGNGLF